MTHKPRSLVVLSAIRIVYGLFLSACVGLMMFVLVSIHPTISFLVFTIITLILFFVLSYPLNGYYLLKLNYRAVKIAPFLDIFWFAALTWYFILINYRVDFLSLPASIMTLSLVGGILFHVISFLYFCRKNTRQLFTSHATTKRTIPLFLKIFLGMFILGSAGYFFFIEHIKVRAFEYYIAKPVPQNVKISKVTYGGFLDKVTTLIFTVEDSQFQEFFKDYHRFDDCVLGSRGTIMLKGSTYFINDFHKELKQAQRFECYQMDPDSLYSYVIWIPETHRAYFYDLD